VSADEIMATFTEIFELADALTDEGYDFNEQIIEFETHSFIIRVIDGGYLVVLSGPTQRGQLVKLQVGLGLFAKSIVTALNNAVDQTPAVETPAAEPVVTAPVAEPAAVAKPDEVEQTSGAFGFGKKLLSRAADAMGSKTPKGSEEEPPLDADGNPKVARFYRGQTYYD
ncbi:MAG: hypothetical protein ACSHWY_15125, partial [Octadecabacter sp.]